MTSYEAKIVELTFNPFERRRRAISLITEMGLNPHEYGNPLHQLVGLA